MLKANIIKTVTMEKRQTIVGEVINEDVAVTVTTRIGGKRILKALQGEGLPRIC